MVVGPKCWWAWAGGLEGAMHPRTFGKAAELGRALRSLWLLETQELPRAECTGAVAQAGQGSIVVILPSLVNGDCTKPYKPTTRAKNAERASDSQCE